MFKIKSQVLQLVGLFFIASVIGHPARAIPPYFHEINTGLNQWSGEFNIALDPQLAAQLESVLKELVDPNSMGGHTRESLKESRLSRQAKWKKFVNQVGKLTNTALENKRKSARGESSRYSYVALRKLSDLVLQFWGTVLDLNLELALVNNRLDHSREDAAKPMDTSEEGQAEATLCDNCAYVLESKFALLMKATSLLGLQFNSVVRKSQLPENR